MQNLFGNNHNTMQEKIESGNNSAKRKEAKVSSLRPNGFSSASGLLRDLLDKQQVVRQHTLCFYLLPVAFCLTFGIENVGFRLKNGD